MYYFHIYVLIFLFLNIWLFKKIKRNLNDYLVSKKVDDTHPIMYRVLVPKQKRKKSNMVYKLIHLFTAKV